MFQCKLTKLSKIKFVDDGVCGDIYKENGTKYYSIECSFASIDESNYHKCENVYLLLSEEELNRLINEPFYYNKNDKKIITGCSKSISKEDLEYKYKKGFADGAKAVCSLILEELKDQRFEILDNKNENYEVALKTINESIKSVQDRLDKYNDQK